MAFQILSLSGGGYRGLFTAEILARLEDRAGKPLGQCFDMIAGTSIGGIMAIGLALGKPAAEIRDVFQRNGTSVFPTKMPVVGKAAALVKGIFAPQYDDAALRGTIEEVVGSTATIADCGTRLLVPAVNVTAGRLQMFKTPHDGRLTEDGSRNAMEVALATSAAPLYFPLARVGSSLYADGGLAANAPDVCAVHEAVHFCEQSIDDVSVLSIGRLPRALGYLIEGQQVGRMDVGSSASAIGGHHVWRSTADGGFHDAPRSGRAVPPDRRDTVSRAPCGHWDRRRPGKAASDVVELGRACVPQSVVRRQLGAISSA